MRTTDRDRWLLETVGKLRFATTSQLARLHFKSRWGANKRLRKLLDAGLVRVWVRSLSEENLYSLAPKGARQLEGAGAGDAWTTPRGLDRYLDHLLAINDVRIAVALDLPISGGELAWWRSSDSELDRGKNRLVPDALFGIRWEEGVEGVFALEVENQGRSPRKFLRKALAYRSVGHRDLYGVSDIVTLVVGRDARWIDRYLESMNHANLGGRIVFTSLGAVKREGASAVIWRRAKDEHQYSLRDLASLPYGKEELVPGTPTSRDT